MPGHYRGDRSHPPEINRKVLCQPPQAISPTRFATGFPKSTRFLAYQADGCTDAGERRRLSQQEIGPWPDDDFTDHVRGPGSGACLAARAKALCSCALLAVGCVDQHRRHVDHRQSGRWSSGPLARFRNHICWCLGRDSCALVSLQGHALDPLDLHQHSQSLLLAHAAREAGTGVPKQAANLPSPPQQEHVSNH